MKTYVQDLVGWTLWFTPCLFYHPPVPPRNFLWKINWKKSFDTHSFWRFFVIMWLYGPQLFSPVICESIESL